MVLVAIGAASVKNQNLLAQPARSHRYAEAGWRRWQSTWRGGNLSGRHRRGEVVMGGRRCGWSWIALQ